MELPFKKIQHRTIAVVIFASLLPVVLIGAFFFTQTRDELTLKALSMQKALAEAVRQGLYSQVLLYGTQLEEFAEDMDVQSMKPDRQRPAIFRFLDLNPIFFSMFVYDTEGKVVSVGYRNRFTGDDFLVGKEIFGSSRPKTQAVAQAIKKVLCTGETFVSERVIRNSRQTLGQLLVLSPIHSFVDSKKIIGILSAGIEIDGPQMQGTLENYFIGENAFILLTDSSGNLIARKGNPLPEGLTQVQLSHPISETGFESTWTILSGREYFVTLGRIPAIGCIVITGTPRAEIFGFIQQLLWGMFLLTVISLLAGVFISLILSNTLVKPIMELIEGIKKVSVGVVSHRIPVEGESELSEACEAFNEMASQLEKNRLLEEIWNRTWKPPS